MTTFDNREKAAEGKFALDAEMEFKARARRDRMVGAWAAAKMGLNAAETEAYGKSLVVADMELPGDGDVIAKLKADFAAKKIAVTDQQIDAILQEKFAEAVKQLKDGV